MRRIHSSTTMAHARIAINSNFEDLKREIDDLKASTEVSMIWIKMTGIIIGLAGIVVITT